MVLVIGELAWTHCLDWNVEAWNLGSGKQSQGLEHSPLTQDSPVKLTASTPECFQDSKIPVDDKHIKRALGHHEGQTVGQKDTPICSKGPVHCHRLRRDHPPLYAHLPCGVS